ncbi:hypothetical protein [Paraburkholderia sp. DHOC27]|uniref:hypothetical protein n=1 Tax=Paraburkholderia sp. DHOC27 TaxID=2303330 RepID=UPI000E3BA50E|nr:hypothetical protein [Paraburkholderia sp. DHOC27]RFU46977.1 hypothetical protein D0B32_12450 [Paraburkholderia sp. DHOC27]
MVEHIYAEIGRAVISCQMFEICFIATSEGVRMVADPAYWKTTAGCITENARKQRTSAIVERLQKDGAIAGDLQQRFSVFIENRNTLIHRWFMNHGISDDPVKEQPLLALAQAVHAEAKALTRMMAGYMMEHAYPEKQEVDHQKLTNMFNLMHLDTRGAER